MIYIFYLCYDNVAFSINHEDTANHLYIFCRITLDFIFPFVMIDMVICLGVRIMYKVNLDIYSGPLDLLFFLIEKNEIDIDSIELSVIADQFISYIQENMSKKMENISSFLVMASKLMHMKSLKLLPRKSAEEEEELAKLEEELHGQMNQYILFKELSTHFSEYIEPYNLVYERTPSEMWLEKKIEIHFEEINPQQLHNILVALLQKKEKNRTPYIHTIKREIITVDDCMNHIKEQLIQTEEISFRSLVEQYFYKEEIINFFLATLELSKEKIIELAQESICHDIIIKKSFFEENYAY